MDMKGEGRSLTLEELLAIHRYKTAALLIAAAQFGVLAAGGTDAQLESAERYAARLGLAYQIVDDILDATATTETLGKTAGKDSKSEKTTFLSLMSEHDARRFAADETLSAVEALRGNFKRTDFLEALALSLEERKY
jgi:geranylgeranyl pyrophosphate synthase